MKRVSGIVMIVAGLFFGVFFAGTSWAQTPTSPTGIDKMYVLHCGWGHSTDISVGQTNNVDEGVAHDDPVHCYLIHHTTKGYFLMDTGISDYVVSLKDGWSPTGLRGNHWTHPGGTLLSQLDAIGVKPSDIHMIGISHFHQDHTGNVEEFPDAVVYMQRLEYEEVFPTVPVYYGNQGIPTPPNQPLTSFRRDHPVKLLDGDADPFGDKSLMLFPTPGHTAGHQSTLVHLPKTGWVILTGDAVHSEVNWINFRVPRPLSDMNKVLTLTSMERMKNIMEAFKAQLWINHDHAAEDTVKYSPEYYQ